MVGLNKHYLGICMYACKQKKRIVSILSTTALLIGFMGLQACSDTAESESDSGYESGSGSSSGFDSDSNSGSDSGSNSGSDSDSSSGSDSGSNSGSDSDSNSGSDSGSNSGSDSGSNSGSDSDSNSGSDSGSNSGSGSGSNSGFDSGSNSGSDSGSSSGSDSDSSSESWKELPLLSISDLKYKGAFRLSGSNFEGSSLNWVPGAMTLSEDGESLFVAGHAHHDQIFEVAIPPLVDTLDNKELPIIGPTQQSGSLMDRPHTGNDDHLDVISGMLARDGKLYVNAYEYFDAGGANTLSTFVIEDSSDIRNSEARGYFSYQATEKAAGWLSHIPTEFQDVLGGKVISGHSSGVPINLRNSMGPCAYVVDDSLFTDNTLNEGEIPTTELLSYTLDFPLTSSEKDPTRLVHPEDGEPGSEDNWRRYPDEEKYDPWDLYNTTRTNKLWNHSSAAVYGLIVPGTRTYLVIGSSAGNEGGIGYKIIEDDGYPIGPGNTTQESDGFMPMNSKDRYNYYWAYDMADLIDVKNGNQLPYEVRPYAFGEFNVPFQVHKNAFRHRYINKLGGGAYDPEKNVLYVLIRKGGNFEGSTAMPPVIAAYELPEDYSERTVE